MQTNSVMKVSKELHRNNSYLPQIFISNYPNGVQVCSKAGITLKEYILISIQEDSPSGITIPFTVQASRAR